MLEVLDLGRENRISASALLLSLGNTSLLVDCGLDPKTVGRQATACLRTIRHLDAAVLTHCHLDHLGGFPLLTKNHPQAPILSTHTSALLAGRLLRNSYQVMRRVGREKNIAAYPLYGPSLIRRFEKRLVPLPFHKPYKLKGEVKVQLFPAGHVGGAAGVLIEWKKRSCFITGDFLPRAQRTLEAAHFPQEDVEVLITESTRGATQRPHGTSRESEIERLINHIQTTLKQGGSILIPVFALGRMQEILTILSQAQQANELPKFPIFCSGLGRELATYLDRASRTDRYLHFDLAVLEKLGVEALEDYSRIGGAKKKSAVYVLSSGMLAEMTPSYQAAASLLGKERNSIAFVGYCDPDTPGGALLAHGKNERFYFQALSREVTARASVEHFDLSTHADKEDILQLAKNSGADTILLQHGDAEAKTSLQQALLKDKPTRKVEILHPRKLVRC